MKIRILDRIAAAIAGFILISGAVLLCGNVFLGRVWIEKALKILKETPILTACALIILLADGILCLMILFRHVARRKRYLKQHSEAGECQISLKALDEQVEKCLINHPELEIREVRLENLRNSLCIHVRGNIAGGISIPLTVETMQNEIREYIRNCSGVEVREIRFRVEETGADAANAPYMLRPAEIEVPDPLCEPETEAFEPKETKASTMPENRSVAKDENISAVAGEDNDDERPLHQRIFATAPEACIVPCPPEQKETENTEDETNMESAEVGTCDILNEETVPASEPVTNMPFSERVEGEREEI